MPTMAPVRKFLAWAAALDAAVVEEADDAEAAVEEPVEDVLCEEEDEDDEPIGNVVELGPIVAIIVVNGIGTIEAEPLRMAHHGRSRYRPHENYRRRRRRAF